ISVGIYENGIGEIGMVYDVMNNQLYSGLLGGGAYRNDQRLQQLNPQKTLDTSIISLNHHWLMPNRIVDEKYLHKLIRDVRSSRSFGSAALEFMHVAEGSSDAYVSMKLTPWDFAAGKISLNAERRCMSVTDGKSVNVVENSSFLICITSIQEELLHTYLLSIKK